jgi:hypothetical protein
MHSTKKLLAVSILSVIVGISLTWAHWSYVTKTTIEIFTYLKVQEQTIQFHSMYLQLQNGDSEHAADFLELVLESNCELIENEELYSELLFHVDDIRETTELCD